MTPDDGGRADGAPLVVDVHGHISQLEAQDIGDVYDKRMKDGMSHRDNLLFMDALGVDVQVLHCHSFLHAYHRRVMREHPDRFVAIAKVDERKLPYDEGLELIRMYVEDWGFKAWWYGVWPLEVRVQRGFDPTEWGLPDPYYHFDHERYDPQWALVESLGVPAVITSAPQNFRTLCPALLNVFEKHPDLTVVIMHGIDPASCLNEDGTVSIPESAARLIGEHDVYMEVLPGLDGIKHLPNRYGRRDQVIRAFYDTFGPSKLMWGSEFTNVEVPTVEQYRYQFDYLTDHCPYMSDEDIAMIRGGNAMKVFGLSR